MDRPGRKYFSRDVSGLCELGSLILHCHVPMPKPERVQRQPRDLATPATRLNQLAFTTERCGTMTNGAMMERSIVSYCVLIGMVRERNRSVKARSGTPVMRASLVWPMIRSMRTSMRLAPRKYPASSPGWRLGLECSRTSCLRRSTSGCNYQQTLAYREPLVMG